MSLVAIVMAGGKGTRMRSERPKVLHEMLHVPMIHFTYAALRDAGVSRVLTVVGHGRDQVEPAIERYSDDFDNFVTVVQEPQNGTGHAVMVTRDLAERHDRVLVLNGDIPCMTSDALKRFFHAHDKSGARVSAMTTVLDDPAGFGRVLRDKSGAFVDIVEHKDARSRPEVLSIREINGGVYLAEGRHLFNLLDGCSNDNAQSEYYLPDVLATEREWGQAPHLYVEPDPLVLNGINNRAELAEAEAIVNARLHRSLRKAGVTLLGDTARIAPDAEVGADTVIYPGVELRSGCRVGAGVTIETGSILTDVDIAAGAWIKPYSVLESCQVGEKAIVGPYARLRPGTEIGKDARVGNFVELKKTILGEGSKANHLSYLGDATIGQRVNVGAGTITCNYDGYGKFETIIDDDVLIGSDTQLVAPVRVGKRAVLAAGTTLTKDVPAGALAVTRPEQVTREGYRERLEARYEATGRKRD